MAGIGSSCRPCPTRQSIAGVDTAPGRRDARPPPRCAAPQYHAFAARRRHRRRARRHAPSSFFGFVREGVHHILIGYDHILFLLSLAAARRVDPQRGDRSAHGRHPHALACPRTDLRLAMTNVLKVVTAFTVAHSITLALSVLNIVNPPSRWVESIIAASVVLAALNNIWPLISEARWKLTFVFGLVHGFGFASALKDAGLAKGALVGAAGGFQRGRGDRPTVHRGRRAPACLVAAPHAHLPRRLRGRLAGDRRRRGACGWCSAPST